MTRDISLFALATGQLIETIGFVVSIFSMTPFYAMNIC